MNKSFPSIETCSLLTLVEFFEMAFILFDYFLYKQCMKPIEHIYGNNDGLI